MPRSYVDNAYNRRVGRVGMPVGSCVISRSGLYLGSQEYVDNSYNRSLGRVGLPRGSSPHWDCGYTGKSTSDFDRLFYTDTCKEEVPSSNKPKETKIYKETQSPLSKISEQETRSVFEFEEAEETDTLASPKHNTEEHIRQETKQTTEASDEQRNVRLERKRIDKLKLELDQLKGDVLIREKEIKKKENTLNDSIKQVNDENGTLKAKLLKTEQNLASKTEELSNVQEILDNKLAMKAKEETSALKARILKTEHSLANKAEELSSIQGKLDKSAKSMKETKEENGALKARILKTEHCLAKKAEELSSIQGKLDKSEKHEKVLAETHTSLVDENRQLADQLMKERHTTELERAYSRKLSDAMTPLLECLAGKDKGINRLKEIQELRENTIQDVKEEHKFVAAENKRKSEKVKTYERLLREQQVNLDREAQQNAYAWRLMTMLSNYMDTLQQRVSEKSRKQMSMATFTAEIQVLLTGLTTKDRVILQLLNEKEDIQRRLNSQLSFEMSKDLKRRMKEEVEWSQQKNITINGKLSDDVQTSRLKTED